MRIILNCFYATNHGEKRQIPAVIKFKRKFTNNAYYFMVVFPDGEEIYMPLESLEKMGIVKINTRKIKTI